MRGVNYEDSGGLVSGGRGGQLSGSALLCLEGFCLLSAAMSEDKQGISNEICFSKG